MENTLLSRKLKLNQTKFDTSGAPFNKINLSSLKTIFVAGEFCDYETKLWAEKTFKVPILNNWWQSETGHPITALCLGYGHHPSLPKHSTGPPIPGYHSKFSSDSKKENCI